MKAKNVVMVEVDGVRGETGIGAAGVTHTNTDDPLYIGGVPGNHSLTHSLTYHSVSRLCCVDIVSVCRLLSVRGSLQPIQQKANRPKSQTDGSTVIAVRRTICGLDCWLSVFVMFWFQL